MIEETFEYRMSETVRKVCREWEFVPKNEDELFDFLSKHLKDFGRLVLDDMTEWAGEDFWFAETQGEP